MTRAAIYVRLSRESEASSSVQRQRADCEQLVDSRGFIYSPADDYYEDSDLSAYDESRRRPAYERLVKNLDRYDALVVWKVDRLYRRFDGIAKVMAGLSEHDVALVSVTEANLDIDDPMGKAIVGFLGAQAEKESENTSLRIRSAQERNRQQGFWHGGRYPFGYDGIRVEDGGKEGTRLVLVPEEAEVVREVADRVLEGEALNTIVRDLNDRGALSPGTTDDWSYPGLKGLLENPTTAGYVATKNGSDDGERHIVYHEGEPVRVVEGEPVLDHDTWERVRDSINRLKGSRPSRPSRSLLAGLVKCGECGYALRADMWAKYPKYVCRVKYERGEDVCPGNGASMNEVDDFVLGVAEGLLDDVLTRGADRAAQREAEAAGPLAEQLSHLQNLEAQQERELDRLLYEEGRDYEDRAVQRHQKRMERTRKKRDEVQAQMDRLREGDRIADLRDTLGDDEPVATFLAMDTEDQRHVLTMLVERVEIDKARGPSAQAPKFDTDRVTVIQRS